MSTGDQNDIAKRITTVLPTGWFTSDASLIAAITQGLANGHAFIYSLIQGVKSQTRIKTATDAFLELIAQDFFGSNVVRRTNQSDKSFKARITSNLFRERATRRGLSLLLTELTGRAPAIFEPSMPSDTGAYRAPNSGYGLAGGYGSVALPFQAFVTVYRAKSTGIPTVAGYGTSSSGYSVASQGQYASINSVINAVNDADIYAAIDSVKPAASTIWTRISS